jgi:glucose-6-phosphate dehydrogenase assembly protein OpcA
VASDVTIVPVLDEPLRVRPDGVEAALDKMWRESAPAGSDESTVRLRLLNFVAIGAGGDAAARFETVMAALPAQHPCRGILATTAGGASTVEASIGARCLLTPGGARHLCSEEITLTAAPGQERALASAVLALLVPELTVSVWVMGGMPQGPSLVDELASAADQLFFDSAEASDAASSWGRAAGFVAQRELVLLDLAWRRTAVWRALISQLFDSADAVAELGRLTSITLASGGPQPAAEALLTAGWLVSRFGFTIADSTGLADGGLRATLYDGSRGVTLAIAPSGDGVALRSVDIRSDAATLVVDVDAARDHMHVSESVAGRESRRTVARPADDDGSLFIDALDAADAPSVYSDAVSTALSLIGRAPLAATGTPRPPA